MFAIHQLRTFERTVAHVRHGRYQDGEPRFAFLTCEPNPLVEPLHAKAMPVILQPDEYDGWLSGEYDSVCALASPFPSQLVRVL